jgi:hypothetical protein
MQSLTSALNESMLRQETMRANLYAIGRSRREPAARDVPSSTDADRRGAALALRKIRRWRTGCACGAARPEDCAQCTRALIDALERDLALPVAREPGPSVESGEPVPLVLRWVDNLVESDDGEGEWLDTAVTEPPASGTYEVRMRPRDDEPVFELQFDATPGVGWRSGEQAPNDYAVLPMSAQWRLRHRSRS